MANRYISDLHFGHANIIAFDNRPYLSVRDMDDHLIKVWNCHVHNNDTVYILGDFCWDKEDRWIEILSQLSGKKVLIRGNHDLKKMSDKLRSMFVEITDYKEIDDCGRKVVLSHYPIPCFKNHFYGWIHLYGHVHNSFEANMMEHTKRMMTDLYGKMCRMFNVGCMMPYINYAPRTLDHILANAEKHETGVA